MENKRIILDTNVVYYLAKLSTNKNFDSKLFLNEVGANKENLSITYFSFFEILNKLDNRKNQKNLEKVLNILITLNFGFFYDKTSNINYNKIFFKCVNSKNKRKYYKNHLQNQVVKYFTNFLTELSLLFGGIYLYLIHFNQEDSQEEHYQKSVMYVNKQFDSLFAMIENSIYEMYSNYFNSNKKTSEKQEIRKNQYNDILIEIFKLMVVIYKCFKDLSKQELTDEEQLNYIKTAVRNNNSINLEDVKSKFQSLRGNRHFEQEFHKLYDSLYAHRSNDTRSDVFKFIIVSILKGHNFDFNDIVDYVNLISPKVATNLNDIKYLTTDKRWIRFLQDNNTNLYYNDLLSYISHFVKI